jgi:hypothetical protein
MTSPGVYTPQSSKTTGCFPFPSKDRGEAANAGEFSTAEKITIERKSIVMNGCSIVK